MITETKKIDTAELAGYVKTMFKTIASGARSSIRVGGKVTLYET